MTINVTRSTIVGLPAAVLMIILLISHIWLIRVKVLIRFPDAYKSYSSL